MSRLELILIFVLQIEAGICGESIYHYNTAGHNVTLSCGSTSLSDTTCAIVSWLYNRDTYQTLFQVNEGKVQKSSVRADRLSLGTDCSLVINNITAEDAGRFICRLGQSNDQDINTYLNVLTISLSPPDTDPETDEVTLECSLFRYRDFNRCEPNSIRWVDETGTVLDGEGVRYKFLRQTNCASYLNVKHQSGNNRRYTCQFVDKDNTVKVEADYTPVFKNDRRDDQPVIIIIGAVVGVLVLLLVVAAVFIKYRKRAEVTEDAQKPTNQQSDEPESTLTYVTVSQANQQAPPKRRAEEEEVTYSTVRTQ